MKTLQFAKVPLFSVRALAWVNQGDIPLLLLHLLVQLSYLKSLDPDSSEHEQGFPHFSRRLGKVHGVEVTELSDGLKLLEEPHDGVQGELRCLEDHKAFQPL